MQKVQQQNLLYRLFVLQEKEFPEDVEQTIFIPLGEKKIQVAAGVPYGRMGTPEDLAGMAVFLASEESNYIVAQTYNVDGGQWMS